MVEYKKEVINYSFQESSKMNDLISDSKRNKMLNGDSLEELISNKCSEDIESASEKNTSSSRKGFVLLLIGVVCLFSTVLLLLLLPLSNGCLRMRADPLPCSTCPQTLGNTNLVDGQCAVHRTCVSCTSTQVAYSRSGQCLIASVTCPNVLPSNSPRVRLLKADNTYVDTAYISALSLSCTSGSSWTYIDGTGTPVTNIKKAICFGKMENTQESPIDLNTNTAVHTSLYNASQFKVSYGSGIIDHISVARTYGGFHAVMKANANAFFTASHLDARYRLVQYHGHWNMDTLMRGSEHTIDGIPFNAELHFVHMREDFTSFQQAVAEGGVAVIGILLHNRVEDNPVLTPLIDAIDNWLTNNPPGAPEANITAGAAVLLQDPAVFFPVDRSYLAYTGSLTTAGFDTCVAWNVLKTPIAISNNQLSILGKLFPSNDRALKSTLPGTTVYTSSMLNNRRPIIEEEEILEKENDTHIHTHKPISSFIQKEEMDGEDEEVLDGIELSTEELEFLHRLRQKYIRRKSQLRSKLLEWTR